MADRTRVLVADFALAAGAVTVGLLFVGGPAGWNLLLAALGTAAFVPTLYLLEQTPVFALVERHSPGSYGLAFVGSLGVALALVLGWAVVASPAATLLFGMGAGLAGYRFVYGILEPVPEGRLVDDSWREIDPPP
jgi:hypothetical protein